MINNGETIRPESFRNLTPEQQLTVLRESKTLLNNIKPGSSETELRAIIEYLACDVVILHIALKQAYEIMTEVNNVITKTKEEKAKNPIKTKITQLIWGQSNS